MFQIAPNHHEFIICIVKCCNCQNLTIANDEEHCSIVHNNEDSFTFFKLRVLKVKF